MGLFSQFQSEILSTKYLKQSLFVTVTEILCCENLNKSRRTKRVLFLARKVKQSDRVLSVCVMWDKA